MQPVIQLFILLFGFIFGFILYELTRYRIGGIVAIPIMVIYIMDNPVLLPIFFLSIGICLAGVQLIAEKTLLYGRRLLYLNLAVSIVCTSLMIFSVSSFLNIDLTTLTVGTIFPGIVAFNVSRETFDLPNALKSGGMMLGNFLIVLLFGLVLVMVAGG
jgi:hypothetical protein